MPKIIKVKYCICFFRLIFKYLLSFIFCFACKVSITKAQSYTDSIPQKAPKNVYRFLQLGLSVSGFSVRDHATSPLIYSGFQKGINMGYMQFSNRCKFTFDYEFLYGHLTTRNYPEPDKNKSKSFCNYLNSCFLVKAPSLSSNTLSFWFGSDFNLIANIRDNSKFNNSNINYEGFASLAPMFTVDKLFDLKQHQINLGWFRYPLKDRKLKLVFSALAPVVTCVYRPGYSVIEDFVDGRQIVLDKKLLKLVSINDYSSLTTKIDFFYYLHNGNMLKFGHIWNFYSYNPGYNSIKSVNNCFSISMIFWLNKRKK